MSNKNTNPASRPETAPAHEELSKEGQEAKLEAEQADTAVAEQVQENVDRETSQGFLGTEVDPTPNENYTVAGVTSGAPTPETDVEAAAEAANATTSARSKFTER